MVTQRFVVEVVEDHGLVGTLYVRYNFAPEWGICGKDGTMAVSGAQPSDERLT
jgi:hypothetical protein